ncbi:hypothetical protein H4S01_005230 [Coemansia sp. RSA 2610]|nr:hypothetical protein H4S01_005230 [Coemansia sp. RSA 2610]
MANSGGHSAAAGELGTAAPAAHFRLFSRPDFIAAVNNFREHFGQEVRSRTTEGYTFLGRDRHGQQPPAQAGWPAAPRGGGVTGALGRIQTTQQASPVHSNTSHVSLTTQPLDAAGAARGGRVGAGGPATATTTTSSSQRENENPLDNLLSYIKPSPQSAPNTARSGGGPADMAGGSAFKKTVVVGQAQSRLDVVSQGLPEHLSVTLPPMERLLALRAGLGKLAAQVEQQQQQQREQAQQRDARKRSDAQTDSQSASADQMRKRSAGLVFHIQVPKKARRSVIDAIVASSSSSSTLSSVPSSKRRVPGVSDDSARVGPKRARKQPAAGAATGTTNHDSQGSSPLSTPPSSSDTQQLSPPTPLVRSGEAARSSSSSSSVWRSQANGTRARSKSRSKEPRGLSMQEASGGGLSEAEVERIRRQSGRLEVLMREFKHGGDAERMGGRAELEIGYYLESLACCLEDFWCRRAWQQAGDVRKNWATMLAICEYLGRRCGGAELAAQRGSASLIAAVVHYQLAATALAARSTGDGGQAARDAAEHLEKMERMEQDSGAVASAHGLARQFPRVWQRCQEAAAGGGRFELRSTPHMRRWPAVAYPVGATSNPLDVANFVRQVNHEWLERSGLSLDRGPRARGQPG